MDGQVIGPYRILAHLGAGGMGEVFLAEDPRLGRRVAIKRATDTSAGAAQAWERLRREARAAAQLTHPNVAAIYDVLDAEGPDGPPHIVMEYVEGETLAAIVRRGPLPPESALAIARQIGDALVDAHAHGVIHRDLKPANVMLTADGRVKVLDFGLAREPVADAAEASDGSSVASQVYGTPGYMAPEQLMGRRGDGRSDIYSFGALLFELLTGTPPFKATNHLERALAGVSDSPPDARAVNPLVPAALNEVVARALAFRPEARFQTAQSLRAALGRATSAVSEAPTLAVDIDRGARSRLWRSWSLWQIAGIVVLVALGLAAFWRLRPESTDPRPAIVAVLPFAVADADVDLEALEAGLADLIVNGIAASGSLTALPRSAVLGYRAETAAALDVQQIARDLGVNRVVTGALRRTADGVELTIRIVRVERPRPWERTYPGALEDALTLGRRILGDVVAQLGAASPLPQPRATSLQAFQQYSQGRGLLDRRDVPGNLDRALALFAAAIAGEPDFALAHAALGEAFLEKYRQTRERAWVDRAVQETLLALSIDANQPLVRYSLATILHGTGQQDRAEQELRVIVRTSPMDSAHRLLGIILTERGQIDEAMQEFGRAIDLRPGYWGNYAAQGVAALKTGRYREAEASFLRVTELQPDNADAYGNLGTVYLLTGQRDRAIEQFKRSIESAPSVPAWSNLGTALTEAGRPEEARDAYLQAVNLRPRDPLLHRNLGDSLLRLGRAGDARKAYLEGVRLARDAIEVNPKSPESHGALAICLAKSGHLDEALEHADQAVALAPGSHEPYYRRAAVLALAGRSGDAIVALEAAMTRGLSPAVVLRDSDFESLRELNEFQSLVERGH